MSFRKGALAVLRRTVTQELRGPQLQRQHLMRFRPQSSRICGYHTSRLLRESASVNSSAPGVTSEGKQRAPKTDSKPSYDITFTCKPCSSRSTHRISKQGYHHGSVLITCPECKNRHVISDHLKIFSDTTVTIEDLMREKGQLVKKGTLSEDGDLEFWEDGTITERQAESEK